MSEPLERPLPQTFRPDKDVPIAYKGRHYVIVRAVSLSVVLIEDTETGERIQVRLGEIQPWSDVDASERRRVPDLASLSPEKLEIGRQRLATIEALLAMKHRTRGDVAGFAESLDLSVAALYGLLARYRREGSLTCLIPHAEKGRPRKKRLHPEVEAIVQVAVDESHLTPKRERGQEAIKLVKGRCRAVGLPIPSPTTVRARIQARGPYAIIRAREGHKAAHDRFGPVYGAGADSLWPLQRIEIDHTVADLFVADPIYRQSVARPILTIAIDCAAAWKSRPPEGVIGVQN